MQFKKTLFLIFGILFFTAFTLCAQDSPEMPLPQESTPQVHFQPPKISELNASLFEALHEQFNEMYDYFKSGLVSLRDFLETADWLVGNLKSPQAQIQLYEFLYGFGISLILALVVQQFSRRRLKPYVHANLTFRERLTPYRWAHLFLASILTLVPIILFGLVLYGTFRALKPASPIYLDITTIIVVGTLWIWSFLRVAGLFLRPAASEYQWLPFNPHFLTNVYRLLRRIANVALIGYFATKIGVLINLPYAGHRLLVQLTGLIIAFMTIRLILVMRPILKAWVVEVRRNRKSSKAAKGMVTYLDYASLPLSLLIINSYITWVAREVDEFEIIIWQLLLSFFLIPFFHGLSFFFRRLRITFLRNHKQDFSPRFRRTILYHATQIDFSIKGLCFIAATFAILAVWGISPQYLLSSSWGRLIIERSLSILIIITGALFALKSGEGLLNRYLAFENRINLDHRQKQNMARYKTIHSVTRSILTVLVWSVAILLVLGELEINITPILATVGVLSVGLSFGIRSLVEDFVTGFFMFLENSFAVGDFLCVNGEKGYLESLTVRIIRVRSEDGALHVFPYGKITSLSNQSREYSTAILLVDVGYEADIDQVSEIIRQSGDELRKSTLAKSMIAGPIEVNGVEEFTDYLIRIKVSMRTRPADQYKVQRALRSVIKKNLDAAKIPLPIPQAISYVGKK